MVQGRTKHRRSPGRKLIPLTLVASARLQACDGFRARSESTARGRKHIARTGRSCPTPFKFEPGCPAEAKPLPRRILRSQSRYTSRAPALAASAICDTPACRGFFIWCLFRIYYTERKPTAPACTVPNSPCSGASPTHPVPFPPIETSYTPTVSAVYGASGRLWGSQKAY